MTTIKLPNGQEIEVDQEGFITDPKIWTEEIALQFAKLEGVDQLTEEHWAVIKYIRTYYLEIFASPPRVSEQTPGYPPGPT